MEARKCKIVILFKFNYIRPFVLNITANMIHFINNLC
jgi:hypothetical protein